MNCFRKKLFFSKDSTTEESKGDEMNETKKGKRQSSSNFVKIQMNMIENKSNLDKGLPIKCQSCGGILNIHSKPNIDFNVQPPLWKCDYCDTPNNLHIEVSEIPSQEVVTYILENKNNVPIYLEEAKITNSLAEFSIIFCIDVSGSMKLANPSIEPIAMKYVKNKFAPTRLECVKVAIDSQIQQLLQESPNIRIGLVTFGNEVNVFGDCTNKKKVISGSLLDDFEGLNETIEAISESLISKPIKNSSLQILQILDSISAGGSTALGPGLVAALALANKGKSGSKVIICTDGLANIGLGSVEGKSTSDLESTMKFYNYIGGKAKNKGISISIISLVQSECRLDLLSPISDLTKGSIVRVNPLNLSKDFKNFLSDIVIATQVTLEVRLHYSLKFNKEKQANLINQALLKKEIGITTRENAITFEYMIKPYSELEKIGNFDFNKIKVIPFQAVITYLSLEGVLFQKVISQIVETTDNIAESKKDQQNEVVLLRAAQRMAEHARNYSYSSGRESGEELMKNIDEEIGTHKKIGEIYNKLQAHKDKKAEECQDDDLVACMNEADRGDLFFD